MLVTHGANWLQMKPLQHCVIVQERLQQIGALVTLITFILAGVAFF